MDSLTGTEFQGEGLLWAYDNQEWCIGIKNYKPQNGLEKLEFLERHLETDESFFQMAGVACLLVREADGSFRATLMKPGALYTVPKNLWHTTITKPGVKLLLVERSGTNMENSELLNLDRETRKKAAEAVLATGFGQID